MMKDISHTPAAAMERALQYLNSQGYEALATNERPRLGSNAIDIVFYDKTHNAIVGAVVITGFLPPLTQLFRDLHADRLEEAERLMRQFCEAHGWSSAYRADIIWVNSATGEIDHITYDNKTMKGGGK